MDRTKLENKARWLATVAHHEAGHAIAAFEYGMEAKSISIIPNDEILIKLQPGLVVNSNELPRMWAAFLNRCEDIFRIHVHVYYNKQIYFRQGTPAPPSARISPVSK